MKNRKTIRNILGTIALLSILPTKALCVKLGDVVQNSKALSRHWGFKEGHAFHCGYKAAIITIQKKKYEVSSMRVVGLETSEDYKNFKDLVTKLNLQDTESKTITPYKEFPTWKTEVFHINLDKPKATIFLSLRPIVN